MDLSPKAPGRLSGPPRGRMAGVGWTVAALLSGCYSYEPVTSVAPAGVPLQVELTSEGTTALVLTLGPATVVRGDLTRMRGDSLELAVTSVEDPRGIATPWRREPVIIPPGAVAGVTRRRLGLFRSVLLGGAVLGGAVGSWYAIKGPVLGAIVGGGGGGSESK